MKKDKAEILLEEEEEVGGFPNMDKYLEGRERRGGHACKIAK